MAGRGLFPTTEAERNEIQWLLISGMPEIEDSNGANHSMILQTESGGQGEAQGTGGTRHPVLGFLNGNER